MPSKSLGFRADPATAQRIQQLVTEANEQEDRVGGTVLASHIIRDAVKAGLETVERKIRSNRAQ
jgi:hypothetical protein